jgi:hypothetical protein
MSEKILYSDLFEDDIIAKIGELSQAIGAFQKEALKVKNAIQGEAIELKIKLSRDGLNDNQIQVLANNIDKLSKAIKILDDAQLQASKASVVAEKALQEQLKTEQQREKLAQQQLRTEQQRAKQQKINKDLSEEEQRSLAQLQEQINQMIQAKDKLQQRDREDIKYQDVKQQSLNMLTQTYNTLVSALKKFSAEEKSTIPVLAEMQKQAKALRVEISNQNKEIGNYTFNVGNYQSAFDGLGWSVRNVVRELPALGINLNTFFLAISNNIPLVIDEIKRYNEEQKKVAESGAKVESVGKKIISTILSWQTLLVVGLTILSKYGKQIGEWVVGLFRAKEAVDNLISSQEALNRMRVEVAKSTKDEEVELGLIIDRIKEVEKGTDEWRNAIERVNEITDANLNTTTATIGQVEEVTKAYIEQAIQLAKNQAIINQISENEEKKIKRNLVLKRGGRSADGILSVMGLSYYDQEGEVSEAGKRANKYIEAINAIESQREKLKTADQVSYGYFKSVKSTLMQYENTITDFENWVRSELQILDDKAIQNLLAEYKITPMNEDREGKKGREKTKKDYEDLWRELEEIRVKAMKEGYEKELEAERLANKLFLHDTKEDYESKKKTLEENLKNGFDTKKGYEEKLAELNKQYDEIVEKQEEVHKQNLLDIQVEYEAKEAELRQERLEKTIEALEAEYKIEESYKHRRRNKSEETANIEQTLNNIRTLEGLLSELEALKTETTTDAELETINTTIAQYQDKLKGLTSKLTIDRRISRENPITEWIGGMLTQGLMNMDEEELRAVYIQKLMEAFGLSEEDAKELAEKIGIEKIYADVYKEGITQAKAIEELGKKMLEGISDIADAYLDLADAKLEAAEAGVDAAQQAYDKEQALLEAGYANSVETAWAELEEQKKIMKQAEEEKKKAQKVQLAMDTAQQASSMVTAVSEVYKSFGSNPILAGIMAGIMISSFIASKAMAMQAVNYGDGTVELLDYGGSHASGNDMPLATDRRGRTRRVEKGEAFAVFNKRAVKRHGYSKIKSIVDGINKGQYEDRAFADVERNLTLGMMYEQHRVDLTKVENTLSKVAENTSKQIYRDQKGNLVEINGNVKRIYKA